jgi:outer membrane immunogenic protein
MTCTALVTALAAPAHAADQIDDVIPAAEFEARWTGFYVGVGLSYNDLHGDLTGFVGPDAVTHDFSDWGFGVALEAGYDHDLGNGIVAGIAADANLISGSLGDSFSDKAGATPIDFFGEIDQIYSLTARVGVAIQDQALLYGLGGVSWGHYEISGEDAGANRWQEEGFAHGYTLGAGLETFVATGSTIKIEYRMVDFESVTVGAGGSGTAFEPDTIHQGFVKYSYRF